MGTNADYQRYYDAQLKDAHVFQDFVVECCWNILKLSVAPYSSKVYQQCIGESLNGVEIKHDKKYASTGNLWIEISEKASPRVGPYAQSGIYREDNTWLYIIGNHDTLFVFTKQMLRLLKHSGRYKLRENNTKTSVGFLLPHHDAWKYAAHVMQPNCANKIAKYTLDLAEAARVIHEELLDGKQMSLFSSIEDEPKTIEL